MSTRSTSGRCAGCANTRTSTTPSASAIRTWTTYRCLDGRRPKPGKSKASLTGAALGSTTIRATTGATVSGGASTAVRAGVRPTPSSGASQGRAMRNGAGLAALVAAAGLGGAVVVTGSGDDSVTVQRVVDGDTIKTDAGTVRILAIDTPEVYGHRECGGPEASARMKALLHPGYHVRLVRDEGEPDKDRYGRLLRYVMHGNSDVGKR